MDAMLTSKGDVWVRGLVSSTGLRAMFTQWATTSQNPPEEDVKNCNEEIREACRQVVISDPERGGRL